MPAQIGNLFHVPTVNQQRLDLYLAAEAKILSGQSVRFGDRQLQRADLSEVRAEIGRLQVLCSRESRGSRASFRQASFND